jgi:flagellin-like protein
MNIWGKNERSWRRKNKRAVSPIIATILLVAITVVLAAVLYILIQQYTSHGSSGVPLGSALAFGTSADASWTCASGTPASCLASGAALSYNFTVESASSTLTIGNVIFQLKTSGNTIVSTANVAVAILNVQGAVEGVYTLSSASWGHFGAVCGTSFTTQCGTTTVISTQNLISLVEVGATSYVGYSLVALGSGGYQGSVPASVT